MNGEMPDEIREAIGEHEPVDGRSVAARTSRLTLPRDEILRGGLRSKTRPVNAPIMLPTEAPATTSGWMPSSLTALANPT